MEKGKVMYQMSYSIKDTEWYKMLVAYEYIMIFGAKENAKSCKNFIEVWGGDVKKFVVSEMTGNPLNVEEIPVIDFKNVTEAEKKN